MIRSPRLAATLAALAVIVAACGGSTPAIEDPKEILVKAVEALQQAKSFQFRADLSGSVPLDLTGTGNGQPLDISGTTLEGAVDVANERARLAFKIPMLLNTSGEAIVVDKVAYLKVSLVGPKYQKFDTGQATGGLAVPTDPKASLDELRKGLDSLASPPKKLANERCGDADCYHVQVALDPATMNLGSAEGSANLDVWVRTNDLRPAKVSLTADGGSQGKVTVAVELFGYDGAVTIEAPPADQVEEGSSLPLPTP
jgi:hypothetical protein